MRRTGAPQTRSSAAEGASLCSVAGKNTDTNHTANQKRAIGGTRSRVNQAA